MKKYMQILWLIAAAILMVLPFPLYSIFSGHLDTTNHENRTLAEKPELDLVTLAEYPEAYDAWMNDNLPFRNQLIAMNSLISVYTFHESPSNKVIIGDDGWLFYNDATSIADYQGTNLYSLDELEQIKANMLATKERLAEQGIEFVLLIAPNKEQIYAEKMPEKYGELTSYTRAQQVCDYLEADITVVYVADDLIQAKQNYPEYDFYYHLDTHWNNLGAYVGAKALLQELGCDLPEIDQLSLVSITTSGMDLSAMMNLTNYLYKDVNYDVTGYSGNIVEIVENDAVSTWRYSTPGADSRKVMVIRDSFGAGIAPYLASQFENTVLIHRSYYDVSRIETEQPDIVIYETVERYLGNIETFQIVG